MVLLQKKGKNKLTIETISLLCILLLSVIIVKPAVAVEFANPTTEITLVVAQDGTDPFDLFSFPPFAAIEDPLVDGAGGHTPGLDAHNVGNTITPDLNGVVRTFDSVLYNVHWNVNDVDSSTSNDGVDGIATNVVITLSTRREDVSWKILPFRCKTSGVTPLSSIVDNGAAGDLLTCNLGDVAEGTAGSISVIAEVGLKADGTPSDGGLIPITATIVTEQSALVTSNEVTTTISATPAGDWVKSGAEVIYNVPNSAMVDGAVLIYPLSFIPTGPSPIFAALPAPERGSEPLDDNVDIQLFDHAWDLTPNATFATAAMETIIGRKICGGYDGSGELPYGNDGALPAGVAADGIDNETNLFGLICTDATVSAGLGYPVVQLDITGQDTSSVPAKNTNSNPNVSNLVITLQVAFWVPTTELATKFAEPLDANKLLWNTITATTTLDTSVLDDPFPGVVTNTDPIQLATSSGLINEITINNNSANQTVNPIFTPPPAGASYEYRHTGRFYPGPYQELFFDHPDGLERMGIDNRPISLGGLGPIIDGDIATDYGWHGTGEVSRNQNITLHAKVTGSSVSTVPYDEPIHLCTVIDNNYVEIIDFTSDFLRFETDQPLFIGDTTFPSVSSNTGNASDGIAHVLIGDATSNIGSHGQIDPFSNPWVRLNPLTAPNYVVQVTNLNGTDDFTIPYTVAQNDLGCDTTDAGPLGWVDASGDLSAFITGTDIDGNNVYGHISKIRVLMLSPQSWQNNIGTDGNTSGIESSNIVLNMQARVKPLLLDAPDGSLIRIHTSRGRGVIVDENNFTLASANCTNDDVFDPSLGMDPALINGGWCNLPYDTSVEAAGAATQQIDTSAIEALFTGDPDQIFTSHSDRIVVIDATLGITKTNISGPNDLVENGDLVTFRVEANIIGSPVEHFSNLYVEDRLDLIPNFDFVSQTAPVDASGVPVTDIVNCVDNFGGTQDYVRCDFTTGAYNSGDSNTYRASPFFATWDITVRLTGAPGDSAIENVAVINGTLVESGIPVTVKSKLRNSYAYTGPSHNEIAIRKDVPDLDGICTNGAGAIELADDTLLAGDCSVFEIDGQYQYDFTYTNTGSADLTNVVIIDVFPHTADTTEPAPGDGRTPASAFSGTSQLVSIAAAGATVECTADGVATINRDDNIDASDWTAACDNSATGFRVTMPTLNISESKTIQLIMQTNGNAHNDIYTNTFGARVDEIALATRSNDVSAMVIAQDWSDAPDTAVGNGTDNYSTQANDNGPSHLITSSLYLGACVDDETDGQQNSGASGDDSAAGNSITIGSCDVANDDEDSLTPPVLIDGQTAPTIDVTVINTTMADSTVACWIDYDDNGLFDNATERGSVVISASGTATVTMPNVPATANADTSGSTYMRCRIASDASEVADATGVALTGEVEDYLITIIAPQDWGDAPDSYGTSSGTSGPHHTLDPQLFMGTCVDDETDGQANAAADGDDTGVASTNTEGNCMPANDDENSLTPPSLADGDLAPTISVEVENTTGGNSTIACWIDYDGSGTFENATERGSTVIAASGTATVTMPDVPASASIDTSGSTYMRCRIASDAAEVADPTGAAADGEVEDYVVSIAATFTLGDYVWYDTNQDGVQDADEFGVNGIDVNLYSTADCTGTVTSSTTTANGGMPAADGFYEFTGLTTGNYCVEFTAIPAGYAVSPTGAGTSATDSDATVTADPTIAQIMNINLTADDPDEDMGIYVPGSVSGLVWCESDTNPNTSYDAGDADTLQSAVQVTLYEDTNCNDTLDGSEATTAITQDTVAGLYSFADLITGGPGAGNNPPGCYLVEVDSTDTDLGLCDHPITPGTLTPDIDAVTPNNPNNNFGNDEQLSLGDYVWYDSNQDGVQDAGELGINGVVVNLYTSADCSGAISQTTATVTNGGTDGFYEFSPLATGDYCVEFIAPAGHTISPMGAGTAATDSNADSNGQVQNIDLQATDQTIDMGVYVPGSVSGLVWCESDTNPNTSYDAGDADTLQSAVQVTLYEDTNCNDTLDGSEATTAVTQDTVAGLYSFAGLITGGPGAGNNPPGCYIVEVDATDTDLGACDHPITPSPLTPDVDASNPNSQDNNFGNDEVLTLGDLVWYDNNQDGIQGPNETGVNGITVVLYPTADCTGAPTQTTVTALGGAPVADGWYEFSPLATGDYCIEFSNLPVGWVFTDGNQGGDDTQDSDANPTTGQITNIDLQSNDPDEDAGIYAAIGTVPGNIFCDDSPANGTFDAGEEQPGITINLHRDTDCDGTGDVLFASQDTDSNGEYLFENLPVALSPVPPNPEVCYVVNYDVNDSDFGDCTTPILPEESNIELTSDDPVAPETEFGTTPGAPAEPANIPSTNVWGLLLLISIFLVYTRRRYDLT